MLVSVVRVDVLLHSPMVEIRRRTPKVHRTPGGCFTVSSLCVILMSETYTYLLRLNVLR